MQPGRKESRGRRQPVFFGRLWLIRPAAAYSSRPVGTGTKTERDEAGFRVVSTRSARSGDTSAFGRVRGTQYLILRVPGTGISGHPSCFPPAASTAGLRREACGRRSRTLLCRLPLNPKSQIRNAPPPSVPQSLAFPRSPNPPLRPFDSLRSLRVGLCGEGCAIPVPKTREKSY